MRIVRSIVLGCAALAACAGAVALSGCPSTTTATGYTPITGIVVRSATLTAGHGCGELPANVYRYAAVVSFIDPPNERVVSDVFDCNVDGLFENLPPSPETGNYSYQVDVFAFSKALFPADLECADGGPCQGGDPDHVLRYDAPQAQWKTQCTAIQQQGVTQVALCKPLRSPLEDDGGAIVTSIRIDTASFPTTDGGTITCGAGYDQANAFYLPTGSIQGPSQTGAQPCTVPDAGDAAAPPLVIEPAIAWTLYQINLELLSSDGGAHGVAHTKCAATPEAGATTPAKCDPVSIGP